MDNLLSYCDFCLDVGHEIREASTSASRCQIRGFPPLWASIFDKPPEHGMGGEGEIFGNYVEACLGWDSSHGERKQRIETSLLLLREVII